MIPTYPPEEERMAGISNVKAQMSLQWRNELVQR